MSGIFKGDSIYKSSGGGGGYKDGGELVDAEFIKVDNGTLTTYENTSRDTVNFYFDTKTGEILNSVIEVTTQVNSVINIYTKKNGLLIPIGYIGTNTIVAGKKYQIKIIVDSFEVEEIDDSNDTPGAFDFKDYGMKKVSKIGDYLVSDDIGNWFTNTEAYNYAASTGWQVLTGTVLTLAKNTYGVDGLRSTAGWSTDGGGTQGTNTSGLNMMGVGRWYGGSIIAIGKEYNFWVNVGGGNYATVTNVNGYSNPAGTYGSSGKARLRLQLKYWNV